MTDDTKIATLTRKTLLLASSFLLCTTLAGCAGQVVAAPSSMASATPTQPTSSRSSSSEFQIPNDFPADIPILPGDLALSSVAGTAPNQTWAIEVFIEDLVQARSQVLQQLKLAGFSLAEETGIGTNTYEARLTRADYEIRIKVYLEQETGEHEIRYVITPASA